MYNNTPFLPHPFFRRPRPNYTPKNKAFNNSPHIEQNTIHSENIVQNKNISLQQTDVIFEIFGLKIYFDDLLLICMIFFLYQEGIQDEYLFIALVLLLLS